MDQGAGWPGSAEATAALVSFDGGVRSSVAVQRPDRYAFFRQSQATDQPTRPAIGRGAGLSFAPASFGDGAVSVDMRAFDRVLGFDAASGEVLVEAGITLGALFDVLRARGLFLPVQPGYPGITVGGCIASDVHGKNAARDGTFIAQVRALTLFHPRHGLIEVSPATEGDLFRATCGGLGLTGIIVSARLAATVLAGDAVAVTLHPVPGLAMGAAMLESLLPEHDFAFGWHDLNLGGDRFGRGTVTAAKIVAAGLPASRGFVDRGMSAGRKRALPFPALNRLTSRLMNAAYGTSLARKQPRATDLFTAMFPFYGKEAYFSLYGPPGFHESQVIVPHAHFPEYCDQVRHAVRQTGAAVCFSAMKVFAGTSDMIRFDGTGVSLAIHLARNAASGRLLDLLDAAVVALGGLPNAYKDSRLPRAVFDASYHEADRFRAFIQSWDAKRLFRSAMSDRLGL